MSGNHASLRGLARRLTALEEASRAPAPEGYDLHRRRRKLGNLVRTESLQVQFVEVILLPADYRGKTHLEFVRALPDRENQHWAEYREVPGPGPAQRNEAGTTRLNVVFVGEEDGKPRYG